MDKNKDLFTAKFGESVIFSQNLKEFKFESVPKEWTDNKIYKTLKNVEVSTLFEKKIPESNISVILNDMQELNSKFYRFLNSDRPVNATFYNQLKLKYNTKNHLENNLLLDSLKKINTIDHEDQIFIQSLNTENIKEPQFYNKLMRIIYKYKEMILNNTFFLSLDDNKNKEISDYFQNFCTANLDKLHKNKDKQKSVKSVSPFKKPHETEDYSLFLQKDLNPITQSQISNKISQDNSKIGFKLLLDEFRLCVNEMKLSDEYCSNLLRDNKNIVINAVNRYFKAKYSAEKLSVIYILPDSRQIKLEFNFIDESQVVMNQKYILSALDNPELYLFGKKYDINFEREKFVGSLKLPQNTIFTIK